MERNVKTSSRIRKVGKQIQQAKKLDQISKASGDQRKIPKADLAYEILKENIITLKFSPGMRLEEKKLINELDLGRTPIREGLRMLISEGLVVNYGSSASYVKDLTLKSAKDLLSLLYHLGQLIFNLADIEKDYGGLIRNLWLVHKQMEEAISQGELSEYARSNAEFHRKLVTISNNEYLQAFVDQLYCEETRLSFVLSLVRLSENSLSDYYGTLQKQHGELIELLGKKEFGKMNELYRTHLALGRRRLNLFFAEKMDNDWLE